MASPAQTVAPTEESVRVARRTMEAEGEAILRTARRLGNEIADAAELILRHPGKVVVCGVGKSGHVGCKIAATLSSTGTPAVFLHPSEAMHGDVGVITPGDPVILISRSGNTAEQLQLLPLLRALGCPAIGILGTANSPMGRAMAVLLDAHVEAEADPLALVPTSSTTVAMAVGDALAAVLMHARGFSAEEFARRHPAGQLGRNLTTRVAEVMHSGADVAWVEPHDGMRQVIIAMTEKPLGAACVVSGDGRLLGVITDGDLRRTLRSRDDIWPLRAADVMTRQPVTVRDGALLHEAARLMEDRPSQISVLPVIGDDNVCRGLVRLHDIYGSRAASQ